MKPAAKGINGVSLYLDKTGHPTEIVRIRDVDGTLRPETIVKVNTALRRFLEGIGSEFAPATIDIELGKDATSVRYLVNGVPEYEFEIVDLMNGAHANA